jgi:putative spermidine/putrescine transport system substrate-binding protein/putrescine transport system substrate-binding protein
VFNENKVAARLGAAPTSWSALIDPRSSQRLSDCGVATPNARDAMFVAAWRLMGVDPAHLRPLEIRQAAILMARAKSTMQSFALADSIGALARGAICLTVGTPGEAAAANARAKTMGVAQQIGFAEPKEGGGVEIEALAVPRDAPNPDIAYELIDYLLSPEAASENARASGLAPATAASDAELMKHLWPLGAFDDSFAQAMETEWTRLRTSK